MNKYIHLKTQKSIREYTRKIINEIGICDNIKNIYPEHYYYLSTFMFPRHTAYPDKFFGMINIGIRKNKVFNHYEIYIIKNDNSVDDVSVMQNCVTGKKSNDLSNAMRNTIYSQILDFRNKLLYIKCVDCESENNIHIDHYKPQFIELQKNFIEKNNYKLPTTFNENEFNGKIFKEEDTDFKNQWFEYHLENANMRALCMKCNLTRKKSSVKFKNINKNNLT